jgi:LysM repeat protein
VSNEKMVSGGKVYYMHEVQKGQTLYSISRAYKVNIDDITGENVIPSSGIQTGQVLKIPAREPVTGTTSGPSGTGQAVPLPRQRLADTSPPGGSPAILVEISDQKIVSNNKEYYMHHVLKGQTLYSIAKAYKVTILDIDRANVIPSSGIQAGQVLKIPVSSSLSVIEESYLPPVEKKPETTASPANAASSSPEKAQSQLPHQENAAAQTQLPHQESTTARQQMPHQEKPAEASAETTVPAKNVAQKSDDIAPPVKETNDIQAEEQKDDNRAGVTVQQEESGQDNYKRIVHKVRRGESLSEIADKYGVTVQDIRKTNKGVIFAMPDMRLVILVKEEPDSN